MSIGSYIKGDSINWECTLNQSNGVVNLTGYKIRCEIYDDEGHSVKLATANSGGSVDQIEVTDALNGKFTVHVAKNLTTNFCDENKKAYIEIEIETNDTPSEKFTVIQDELELKDQTISWETPS